MESKGFVEYAAGDTTHFGAKDVVEKEQEYIRQRRSLADNAEIENLSGLALSGGGIRSASFSLGIMQALAHNGWLKKIDYLSTVSGGGYAGSSLSWLLSRELDEDNVDIKRFGVSRKDFPYGSYPMSGIHPDLRLSTEDTEAGESSSTDAEPAADHITERYKGKLLRYLRQQAKYLTPGDGITALSLVAVLLRGALLSLLVYFGLMVLAFVFMHPLLAQSPNHFWNILPPTNLNTALWAAVGLSAIFVLLAIAYSLGTFLWSRKRKPRADNGEKNKAYCLRQGYERIAGSLLAIILILIVLGAVPEVFKGLQGMLTESASTMSDFQISGMRADNGALQFTGSVTAPVKTTAEPSALTALIGVVSTLFGALSGVMAFFKSSSDKKGRLPMGLVVAVGTAALWFGLLIIAYYIAGKYGDIYSNTACLTWWVGIAFTIMLLGRFANINYLSIHRYYRDRLMEAFMPDVDRALAGKIATRAVTHADKAPIDELFKHNNGSGLKANPAPYHLINTNVVLESSKIPKFRGRGGDNFILSPYYCGSNATGWSASEKFMDGRMTLPTAMAISGAAVNPSTGVGGQGVTRQPLLSMLMGLLNIRLGYWAPNPDPKEAAKAIPNFFHPGLSEMFLRSRLHEKANYVQLTDGGHFENLALYELIRRRAKLIIVCDGGADPDFQFTDFANAQEKIRADFGTLIHCNCHDLQALVPQSKISASAPDDDAVKYAKQGYLMRTISYPDNSQGTLLYIKTTFFEKLSADLYGYKKTHPQFPDEPTSDQFFDEIQFEAYRELGFQTAWAMMQDKDVLKDPCVKAFIDRKVS